MNPEYNTYPLVPDDTQAVGNGVDPEKSDKIKPNTPPEEQKNTNVKDSILAETGDTSFAQKGIQSSNYVKDVSGWKLNPDGTLEIYGYELTNLIETYVNPAVAGTDVEIAVSNAAATTTSATYTKLKEILCGRKGSYSIRFDLRVAGGAGTIYGRIYKNGIAYGTERTTVGGPDLFSETLSFLGGDLIQIYGHSTDGTQTVEITNFRVRAAGNDGFDVII